MGLFKKAEYKLENIVEQNRQNPRHFLKPDDDKIKVLKIGDKVKLIFLMSRPQKNGCRAERMWVIIKNISNGVFQGELDNDPYYLKTIHAGDKIEFLMENIATVMVQNAPGCDEEKFAIITKKALKKKEVNWILRTDDIDNEQDSGWQLFYGDEDDAYLNDPDKATIISLADALCFEPLLEKPFSENEMAYEYSKTKNEFMIVNDLAKSDY